MRVPFLLATAALALAALPAAQAQDSCTQASPCPWDVAVDQPGFVDDSSWNWTMGDWMELTVSNDDSVAHTVTLSGYGITLTVPAVEERSQVIQLTQSGKFELKDAPSGDTVPVTVVNGDVVDYEKGLIDQNGASLGGSTSKAPGLELPLLAAALVAVAAARRLHRA